MARVDLSDARDPGISIKVETCANNLLFVMSWEVDENICIHLGKEEVLKLKCFFEAWLAGEYSAIKP